MELVRCSFPRKTCVTPIRWSSMPADQLYRGQTRYFEPTRGWGYCSGSITLRAGQSLTAGFGCVSSVLTLTTASPSLKPPSSIFCQSPRFSEESLGRQGQDWPALTLAVNDLRSQVQT